MCTQKIIYAKVFLSRFALDDFYNKLVLESCKKYSIFTVMADFDKNADNSVAVVENTEYDVPPSGCVVFFNDDYTTKDFVVEVLVSVFHKSEADANVLMEIVHKSGSAAIGVYAFDIAATRASIAVSRARAQGFPLRVEVQEIR